MPDVVFKDLCLDATRPEPVAAFWGRMLGQPMVLLDGDGKLEPADGMPQERTVWVNGVAEPVAAKSRVHLDVRFPTSDVADLVSAGARLVRAPDDDISWSVLEDPDGLVFCAFGPHPQWPAPPGPFELVVDAADPATIAGWWAQRTGASVHTREGVDWVWLEGAAGFPFQYWVFTPVPEPKTVKNRMHWDVTLADADVPALVSAGARVLREPDEDIDWTVLADPEGNEFCAFSPRNEG